MIFKVQKIEEDIEFGCEERMDDEPVMAVVTLLDEAGEEKRVKMPDQLLYDREINEGDQVIFDENGKLQKRIRGDWTERCKKANVNTEEFVSKMEALKAGKKVNWICPFCGGNVTLLEQKSSHTVIGCDSCDMRIQLENH
ncbi:hypothetical protein H6A32_12765 [Drancourtella massiliensis]|uniref:Uncharacterized protein n=1 Tax=Drancourtella massiliensis TaxID=1632013 RepID=A0ABS2EJR0_9FIRM|nr:hypothetical protein [Drancourtella massiliensis]MBM6745157.1 hypothetical protein [Drancourtella massiliensis]